MAKFNVNEFRSQVDKFQGLQVPNLFMVSFSPPRGSNGFKTTSNLDAARILCSRATMPGFAFSQTEFKRQGFGPSERRTTGYIPQALSLEFFLDNTNQVIEFLTKWAQRHAQYALNAGEIGSVPMPDGGASYFGETGYFDDYAMDVTLEVFEPKGGTILTYKFYDCAILNIGSIDYGWQQNNEIALIQTQLSYRTMMPSTSDIAEGGERKRGLNLFQFIAKMKGAAEIVKSIKKPRGVQDALNVINNGKTLLNLFD